MFVVGTGLWECLTLICGRLKGILTSSEHVQIYSSENKMLLSRTTELANRSSYSLPEICTYKLHILEGLHPVLVLILGTGSNLVIFRPHESERIKRDLGRPRCFSGRFD